MGKNVFLSVYQAKLSNSTVSNLAVVDLLHRGVGITAVMISM